jgi:hypothetical protein
MVGITTIIGILSIIYFLYLLINHIKEAYYYRKIPGYTYFSFLYARIFHPENVFIIQPREQYKNFEKFGNIWKLIVGRETYINIIDTEMAIDMLVHKPQYFGKASYIKSTAFFNVNLFSSDYGENWKRQSIFFINNDNIRGITKSFFFRRKS